MKKEGIIKKYGKATYEKMIQQSKDWKESHPEENKRWKKENPDKVQANERKRSHKGGKYYAKQLIASRSGLRGERSRVRNKHRASYRPFKNIIDPKGLSEIHHEWISETANYVGLALVEAEQHAYGYINVIQILEGEITLLTEAEIRGDK